MATAILYYSMGGSTKHYGEKLAAETGADLFEVKERHARNIITAFIPGCIQSGGGKASAIIAPDIDFDKYDDIVVAGPIWAGNPAPAVNAIIGLLPQGKSVTLVAVSGGGAGKLDRASEAIKARGCTLAEARTVSKKQAME
jgi:flavodoxin